MAVALAIAFLIFLEASTEMTDRISGIDRKGIYTRPLNP